LFHNITLSCLQLLEKLQEDFTIDPFCGPINLGVWVENIGTSSIEVKTVWYVERTGPDYDEEPIDISLENRYVPPGSIINVLSDQSIPLTGLAGFYLIKVVTTLGNISVSAIDSSCPAEFSENVSGAVLVAQPTMFASFPNPVASQEVQADDRPPYSIIVANPTKLPMTENRVAQYYRL